MPSQKELDPAHFKVTIFGSARIKPNNPRYKQVFQLAELIAAEGMDIVTGGGPGLMDAANKGHHKGRKVKNIHFLGLRIKLPFEEKKIHLDIHKDFYRFSKRLDSFMELSNVVVVADGGIGTLLELFYTWQLLQVKHICEMPVILIGKQWKGLLKWMKEEILNKRLMDKKDFSFIFIVKSNEEALELIKKFYSDSLKGGHICKNFIKYK